MSIESERKIVRTRAQLLLKKPFFGYLSTCLLIRESKNMAMPTMGTDGKYLYYDDDFVNKCIAGELETIICHEILHLALGHTWRKGNRNDIVILPDGTPILKWNVVCDAVVNYHLSEQRFKLPKGVVRIPEAETSSAEELYAKWKCSKEVTINLFDDHSSWGKRGKEGEGKGKGEGGGAEGEAEGTVSMGESLEEKWKGLVVQARQIEKSQGRGMGSLEELIDDLIEPKLSWKELLRNAIISSVKNDYRIIPPNKKHLWRGMYLPSTYGEEIEIAYAVDTSGSMSTEEVKEGLSELKGICDSFQSYKIHFFQCDDGIQQYKEMSSYNFEFPRKIRGRGGTSFRPVFRYIVEKNLPISCLVYWTDGYGDYPTVRPNYPVVWILTAEGSEKKPPFGHVIKYAR